MHVLFVSACQRRSIKRTARVLDAYATRCGQRTWVTPITQEALSTIHRELRRTATRMSAIACWRNDGRSRMQLQWVVGRRSAFLDSGGFAVGSTMRKADPMPAAYRTAACLVRIAGLLHDLGKFNEDFQNKLDSAIPVSDPVRHEWLSMHLIDPLIEGLDWSESWERALNTLFKMPLREGASNATDALKFLVLTHHRLPSRKDSGIMTCRAYFADMSAEPQPAAVAGPNTKVWNAIGTALKKLDKCEPAANCTDPVLRLRGIATIARAALILADHTVSAREYKKNTSGVRAFANTKKIKGKRRKDQPLNYHLTEVAAVASDLLWRFWKPDLPSLEPNTRIRIDARSGSGAFEWQDAAANAVRPGGEMPNPPTLVLNLSGTGTGKTRMNIRALSALREREPLRVSVAMNLRTLTLQTGDAYRDDLGIGEGELATVIGDRAVTSLHEHARQDLPDKQNDDDDNPEEESYDVVGEAHWIPEWLQPYIGHCPQTRAVIGSPLLVSTVDWIINAGDLHRQGHHARALLRLMSSDLVIDEIDSYDPKALTANLRLITLSGLFGRHVVLSSASLALPVAEAARKAFMFGASMRSAMLDSPVDARCALIGRDASPELHRNPDEEKFQQAYSDFRERLFAPLCSRYHRRAELREIDPKGSVQAMFAGVEESVRIMHDRHQWTVELDNQPISLSIGLVRVANIKTAIPLARYLADAFDEGEAAIVCYHSNHLLIQRAHIERTLDRLLRRKSPDSDDQRIGNDPSLRERLLAAPNKTLHVIVVATPVEEIGRDHDFDWAVIEPSSVQSIVQTAGRVNRHRLLCVDSPNIAILQFNARYLENVSKGKESTQGAFCRPGLEPLTKGKKHKSAAKLYDSHDLKELLDWEVLDAVDARLTQHAHPFAVLDDNSMQRQLARLTKDFYSEKNPCGWMTLETYTESPLRANEMPEERWSIAAESIEGNRIYRLDMVTPGGIREALEQSSDSVREIRPHVNSWMDFDGAALVERAQEAGIDPDVALAVNIRVCREDTDAGMRTRLTHDLSFGFLPEYDDS